MTISAYLIDKNAVNQIDFSNPVAIRKEMVQKPERIYELCIFVASKPFLSLTAVFKNFRLLATVLAIVVFIDLTFNLVSDIVIMSNIWGIVTFTIISLLSASIGCLIIRYVNKRSTEIRSRSRNLRLLSAY